MADCSISFFDRKWRHHDITSIVNGNYVLANFSVILANWWNLDSANKFNKVTMMSSLFWVSLLAVSMSGFEVKEGASEPPKPVISAF